MNVSTWVYMFVKIVKCEWVYVFVRIVKCEWVYMYIWAVLKWYLHT